MKIIKSFKMFESIYDPNAYSLKYEVEKSMDLKKLLKKYFMN